MNSYFIYDTEIGKLTVGCAGELLTHLSFGESHVPGKRRRTPFSDEVFRQISEYLAGGRREFSIPFHMEGTPFQKKVWQALCTIGYGQTCAYSELAEQIGSPRAARAVGMANHMNPIAVIVPCHRIIGKNGRLVGYAGGLDIKRRLLELERRFL